MVRKKKPTFLSLATHDDAFNLISIDKMGELAHWVLLPRKVKNVFSNPALTE